MTLKVWIEHDGIVDTLLIAGDGRHTYNRLRGDVKREGESRGWNKPNIIKVREATGDKELPIQKLDFIKELMSIGM